MSSIDCRIFSELICHTIAKDFTHGERMISLLFLPSLRNCGYGSIELLSQ